MKKNEQHNTMINIENKLLGMLPLFDINYGDKISSQWIIDKNQLFLKYDDEDKIIKDFDREIISNFSKEILMTYADDILIVEIKSCEAEEIFRKQETTFYYDHNKNKKYTYYHNRLTNVLEISEFLDCELFIESGNNNMVSNYDPYFTFKTDLYKVGETFDLYDLPEIGIKNLQQIFINSYPPVYKKVTKKYYN